MTYGRLAQLVEHLLDVQEVTGSSPVPSTTKILRLSSEDFLFVLDGTGAITFSLPLGKLHFHDIIRWIVCPVFAERSLNDSTG